MSENSEKLAEEKKERKPRTTNHSAKVGKTWAAFKAAAIEAHNAGVNVDMSLKDEESGQIVVGKAMDCTVAITANF